MSFMACARLLMEDGRQQWQIRIRLPRPKPETWLLILQGGFFATSPTECIAEFMKKAFTTSAVVSARKAKWDKKTGQVKSDDMDEVDKELQEVTDSWVDSPLQESAVLESGDMAAFNWEDGASIKTMNSGGTEHNASDTEGSFVESDEEEYSDEKNGEEEQQDDNGKSYLNSEDEKGSFHDAEQEHVAKDDLVMSEGDESDEFDEEGYWKDAARAEWSIREVFREDEPTRDTVLEILSTGGVPEWILEISNELLDYQDDLME